VIRDRQGAIRVADWAPLAVGDPMPGEPDGIADLVRQLRGEAQRITAVAGRLRAVNAGDFWTGDAANEFSSRVGRAAPDLDLAAGRIETTVTALNRYLQAMGDCQSRGRTAVLRARDADADIARAQGGLQAAAEQAARDAAAAGVRAAQTPGVSSPAPPTATWVPNWNSVLEEAQQARADAVRLFNIAVGDYDDAVRRCVADLGPAVHDALTDPVHHGLFARVAHAAESGVRAGVHAVEDVNENVVEWSHEHFFTLDGISDSLGIAAAVAGFVPGAEGVALALSATKTALDYGLYRAGKKDWNDVKNDLVGTALFGAGRVLTGVSRARTAAEAAKETATASKEIAATSAEINEAEHAGEVVEPRLLTHLQTTQEARGGFEDITESLGQGTSRSWWRESGHAFRHLNLTAPGDDALTIDRYARYAAKGSNVIESYSKTKDAAQLVKSATELATGDKPERSTIRGYEIL
jgi:hypothetical protein